MESYDLVVIGSGPAGEKGAAQAAYFGKKVALVEKAPHFGGAAANTGTLPSKTLRETALYLSGFKQRGLFGVEMQLARKTSVQDLLYRKERVQEAERARIRTNLDRHAVKVFHGSAAFLDAHTVQVITPEKATVALRAAQVLVATGSSPHRPAMYPFEEGNIYDSDEILHLEAIPESMTVVGGGVIGCEYACLFAALGVKVTLVDLGERLLPFLDAELSRMLSERMGRMGITLRAPDAVEQVRVLGGQVELRLKSGAALQTATVLVASGRSGNTAGLGLEALGVAVGKRGHVEVNAQYQTAAPHIWAVGDVIGFPALASTSMEQARIAMGFAFNAQYKSGLAPVLPYGIYTIPEVSMAGATEEELTKKGVPYLVGRASFGANSRGLIIGDSEGMLKLLFGAEDRKLLGVHVIGEAASELVHIGLMGLLMGATSDLFIQACFNYPTLSETYKYATYDALQQRSPSLTPA